MKVNIDKHGILIVTAESQIEVYALNRWTETFLNEGNCLKDICIKCELED